MTATPSQDDPPDIAGYVYSERLGHGGYSDVYLYEQQMPRRKVAVKVLRSNDFDAELREQFTAEANVMAALADHPSIVPVFAADVASDGRPYLVMMYYPRQNLGEQAALERFTVTEVLRTGVQIASAVETAHRAQILHRDIKPANILTSQYGAPGLTDFGIAGQILAAEADDDTPLSVPWSPPEILYATAPASVQSDVYSLAATLWHLLAGRSPFELVDGDNSVYSLMARIRDLPVPAVGRDGIPVSLERLLSQAMAKSPSARPASAIEFARSLQTIEQELSFPRTQIVVLDDDAVPQRSAPLSADAAGTRVSAQRVRPQPDVDEPVDLSSWEPSGSVAEAPAPRLPVAEMPASPTAHRPQVSAGAQAAEPIAVPQPAERTILRARPDADSGPITIAVEPATRSPWAVRGPLLALAGVIVIGAAVAIALSGGGHKKGVSTGQDRGRGPAQSALVDGADLSTVTFHPHPAAHTISWTFTGQQSSDNYDVRYARTRSQVTNAKAQRTTQPMIKIAYGDRHPTPVYVQLLVVTKSGAGDSDNWQPSPPERVLL